MFKKSTLAAAEAELAALMKRGAGLAQRRDAAVTALATANAERRRLLTETADPSAADLAKVDQAMRDATDARFAAAEAVAVVDARAAEVRATIETLQAAAERERHATAIEASAKAADLAIERMRKAAGELDSARRDLVAALLPEAAAAYSSPTNAVAFGPSFLGTTLRYDHRGDPQLDTLDVEQVAARVAGHLVTSFLPGLGIAKLEDVTRFGIDGQPTRILAPVDGEAARSLLTDPMRVAAARVREGSPIVEPHPSRKPPRRQADGRIQQPDGRCHDKAGVPVTPGGYYYDEFERALTSPEAV